MEKKIDEKEREKLEENIKKEIEKQNKLLKNIFIVLGGVVAVFLLVYLFVGSMKNFEYNGVEFTIEKYCDAKPCLTLYKTSVQVSARNTITGEMVNADYNIYLRNDPRKLENVPIDGEIIFRPNIVLSVNTGNLFCDGDWNLAIGNLQKLDTLGINLIAKNESEVKIYVPQSDYMFVNIKEANETNIIQKDYNSYDLNVANCEILKTTERLMVEAFVQAYENN